MKSKFAAGVFLPLVLAGCGTITLPAAVKMSSGEAMMGTTTAAISGGRFEVATPKGDISCSGNYDALDTRPVITAPVRCSDGRYGTITVLRAPDSMSGTGNVVLADGTAGNIAFGRAAASVLATSAEETSPTSASAAMQPVVTASQSDISTQAGTAAASSPAAFSAAPTVGSTYLGSSSRAYTGNCPTPESLDAAGHRCGARSAASRPGGYSGYGTWATSARSYGTVNVRGYYRKNGTYVRSYSRRR